MSLSIQHIKKTLPFFIFVPLDHNRPASMFPFPHPGCMYIHHRNVIWQHFIKFITLIRLQKPLRLFVIQKRILNQFITTEVAYLGRLPRGVVQVVCANNEAPCTTRSIVSPNKHNPHHNAIVAVEEKLLFQAVYHCV
jgi:hypothetical protein